MNWVSNCEPRTRKIAFSGTHRAVSPAETLERIRPLFTRFGITRLADVTGLDRIRIPVFLCCRPNSRSLSVSQGKGFDPIAAQVSAAMESIELFHAERPNLPLTLASHKELSASGDPIVDVRRLPMPNTSRFHPERPLLWTKASAVDSDDEVWLPLEVVHTSALLPAPSGSGCFLSTSNGLASGNSASEAIVHALCEVIERDAAATWASRPQHQQDLTTLDLTSVGDPACRHLLELYREAGVEVNAWDVTSDVGVPTFCVEISDHAGVHGISRFSGMGAHLSAGVALSRALTEAAQSRLTYITGSRDDLFRRDYRKVQRPTEGSDRRTKAGSGREFSQVCSLPSGDFFEDDIRMLLKQLRACNVPQVYVVNLTSRAFGIPVVRVVVPGLEGPDDDPTYHPGQRALLVREAAR